LNTQSLTWDAEGRLIKVTSRDDANDGFDWIALYDGFGRRLRTTYNPIIAAAYRSGAALTNDSWFDPQVTFLEIAVAVNGGQRTWKIYGPDISQGFAMQGVGGLETTIREYDGYAIGMLNDYFGNGVATITNNVTQFGGRVTSYGPIASQPLPCLSKYVSVAQSTIWRGKRIDPTGFYWFGARYYDPNAGRFISPDPSGHDASIDLYAAFSGDGVNFLDPDGKCFRSGNAQIASFEDSFINGTLGLAQILEYTAGSLLDRPDWQSHAEGMQQYMSPMQRLGLYTPDSFNAQVGQSAAQVTAAYSIAEQTPSMLNRLANWWDSLWSRPTVTPTPAYQPGEIMPNGQPAGTGPGAAYRGDIPTSPNSAAREAVQGGYIDPLSGDYVSTTETLAADHIYPQVQIRQLPGFEQLTPAQQAAVLNNPINFQGLPKTFNSSKGGQLPGDWQTYKGQPLDSAYIQRNQQLQQQIQQHLQDQVNSFIKQNVQN
jgi:RHS repeat-associated protein